MHPVLFHVAGFAVETQGTLYLLAAIIAGVYSIRLCKRRGWDPDAVVPGMLITVLAGFAGARLLHSGGGLSFFGGLATGSLAILGYLRWQGIPVGAAVDGLAPLGPALYALFRLGCFLNGDDYGLPTRLPWGMRFPHAAPPTLERVHPTQLYEMLAMAPVFLWLRARHKAALKPGALAFELCALMGAERFLVEFWRIEPRGIGGLTTAQWTALALAVIGIVGRTHLGTSLPIQRRPFMRKAFRNRILTAVGILGFVATIVVFDLGCPGGTDHSGEATFSIALTPNPASVRIGGTIRIDATVKDVHGDEIEGRALTWTSSSSSIATVSGTSYGLVTGVATGDVTITASNGGVEGFVQVSVTNAPVATVTVSGATSVPQNHEVQLTATLKDDAGHTLANRPIDWSSSSPSVGSVDQEGHFTGLAIGSTTITASSENQHGMLTVTVTPNPVVSVTVRGTTLVDVGQTLQLSAELRDGFGESVSGRTVTWVSSAQGVATVNSNGLVTGVSGGTARITATSENQSGFLDVTVLAQPAILKGRVIDYTTGNGISGATVRFLDSGGAAWGSVTSAADGSFTSPATSTGIANGVFIEGSATGYVTGRIFVASVPVGTTTFTEPVPLVPTSGQTGGISGTVRNALNASGISGATVQLFDNQGLFNPTPIATQTSDGSGNFSFGSLAAGTYRLAASATGYSNAQRTGVAVGNGSLTAGQDLVLSPTGSTAINIVLTWGNTPSDLDSHLTGPNSDGSTRFHVYYASRGSTTAQPFAGLDVDNTSGRGPETITITQMNSGTYRYSVHDFSDRSSTTSSALGSSGAKVQVYTASAPVQTFFVPSQAGTLWTVFEMTGPLSNPVITPKNLMSFISDPATVTAPPMDWIAIGNDGLLIGWSAKQHPKPPQQ